MCPTNLEIKNSPMHSTGTILDPHPAYIDGEGLGLSGHERNENVGGEDTEGEIMEKQVFHLASRNGHNSRVKLTPRTDKIGGEPKS